MKARVLSSLVMAILVVLGIFKLPAMVFNTLALLLMLGGLSEWRKLCSANTALTLLSACGMLLLYAAYTSDLLNSVSLFVLLAIGVFMWLIKALSLAMPVTSNKRLCMFDGMISLGLAWLAMVVIRDQFGQHSLMLVLLIVWGTDTFAYFGGKRFGKTKLAPSISPGKTREGVVSGALVAMLVAVVYTHIFIQPLSSFSQMLVLLFVSILVALISVVGDLSESKLKRAAGIKDSGTIIPGHGGILDRIDGLIAGIVVYAFYASLTAHFLK
jgi:phosphatidate cytidylyltransferase